MPAAVRKVIRLGATTLCFPEDEASRRAITEEPTNEHDHQQPPVQPQ